MATGRRAKPNAIDTRQNGQRGSPESGKPLKQEIRDALLAVLREPGAPATAKASAGRSLLEFFIKDERDPDSDPTPATELSIDQIDAEIERLKNKLGG